MPPHGIQGSLGFRSIARGRGGRCFQAGRRIRCGHSTAPGQDQHARQDAWHSATGRASWAHHKMSHFCKLVCLLHELKDARGGYGSGLPLNLSSRLEHSQRWNALNAETLRQVRQDLFQEIPRDRMPPDMKIEPGMRFQAQRPEGLVMFSVQSVDEDTVTVDLNHPLAGKRLHFDVKVIEVRDPNDKELAALSRSCGCSSSNPADCGGGCSCG